MTKRKLTEEERAIVSALIDGEEMVKEHLLNNFDTFRDANPLSKTFLPTPIAKAYLSRRLFELMDTILDKDKWTQEHVLEICSAAFMLSLAVHKPDPKKEKEDGRPDQ